MQDRHGELRPYRFPSGVDQAIRDHRSATMDLDKMHAVSGGASAAVVPSSAASSLNGRRPGTLNRPRPQGFVPPDPERTQVPAAEPPALPLQEPLQLGGRRSGVPPPPPSSAHTRRTKPLAPGRWGETSLGTQEAMDREFARQLNAYNEDFGESASVIIATSMPSDTLTHASLVSRARRDARAYAVVAPLFNLMLLGGLVAMLAPNNWTIVDVAINPWIGGDQDALKRSGAMCTACLIDGEWWRLASSLFVVSGVAHAAISGLLFAAAATVTGRTGMSIWAFLACTIAGGVMGSGASAVAAQRLVHSTALAFPAAAAATAIVAVASVRRFLKNAVVTLVILSLWLGLVLIASLAPFASGWATLAGAFTGALCAIAAMAPHVVKRRARARERTLVLSQVLLAVCVVAMAAGVAIALLAMPRTGFDCRACEHGACQSFLGWQCNAAVNREGFCRVLVFPDASASLVCPSGLELPVDAAAVQSQTTIDAACESQCRAAEARVVGEQAPGGGSRPPPTIQPPAGSAAGPAVPPPTTGGAES